MNGCAFLPVKTRGNARFAVPLPDMVLRQKLTPPRSRRAAWNLFDCARPQSFCRTRGGKEVIAMIETVTAVLGLVSAGIFIAHAFDGYRSRA